MAAANVTQTPNRLERGMKWKGLCIKRPGRHAPGEEDSRIGPARSTIFVQRPAIGHPMAGDPGKSITRPKLT
jgi:hypothetical protein